MCLNYTGWGNASHPSGVFNLSNYEDGIGVTSPTEKDGVNETFNATLGAGSLSIGSVTITDTNCPKTYIYTNSTRQAADWEEYILRRKYE